MEAALTAVFNKIPETIKLWPHQREAVDFAVDHLNERQGTCIIRMPTGTGKTGVIATLAALANPGQTLVLTPWVNLKNQIIGDIESRFWSRIGVDAPDVTTCELLPSNVDETLANAKILISSFACLTDIRRNHPNQYKALQKRISLIVVDEGHYEPAVEWGQSVKQIDAPTVLLSATPYRNDLKLFRIKDPQASVYNYSHSCAETHKIIRPVIFETLKGVTAGNGIAAKASAFATYWLAAKQSTDRLAIDTPRAIICCDTPSEIEETLAILAEHAITAIGIHDRFPHSAPLYRDVPANNVDAEVWIHQRKLTEGFDDSRFCCVALFSRISNDRRFIQQVGRVIRKSAEDRPDSAARVVCLEGADFECRWQAYRDYEVAFEPRGANHFRNYVDVLLGAQPHFEYFDGRFRKRFDETILDTDAQVSIAPSVLVRMASPNFEFKDYIEHCTDTLNLEDAIILGPDTFGPCQQSENHAVWVYASVANSRLLGAHSLYEVRLQAHCVTYFDGHLLISDTTGTYPEGLIERCTLPVAIEQLSKVFGVDAKMTNVSLQNTIPFDSVIRAAAIRGTDLSRISASLTDSIQICRSARGASAGDRKYVGFQRGRVRQELTETQRKSHQVAEFVAWAKNISQALGNSHPPGTKNHEVLSRYMQPAVPPAQMAPKAISLDMLQPHIRFVTPGGKALEACSLSAEIVRISPAASLTSPPTFEFELMFARVDGEPTISAVMRLEFQQAKIRFWFKSATRNRVSVEDDNYPTKKFSLAEYLNRKQEHILIGMKDGNTIYQGRHFYAVNYGHAERNIVDLIRSIPADEVYSEKGSDEELSAVNRSTMKAFLPSTLFKFIAEDSRAIPFDPEVLVCTDLGSECADFVAINFANKQLAFVHAKQGKGSKISASDFHDIVSQAIKNLVYFSPSSDAPDGVANWTSSQKWNKTLISRMQKNAIKTGEGQALWTRVKDEIFGSVSAQLHVVLATAGCCDLQTLTTAITTPASRTAETGQLMHLLNGLNGTVRSLGARLSILNLPSPPRKKTPRKSKGS